MSDLLRNVAQDRKTSYKTPPASVRDASTSQEARRKKALDEQKRRRAERFDSSRQLDFFADLNLGPSEDEDDDPSEPMREGIAQFASMLPSANSAYPPTGSNIFGGGAVISQAASTEVTMGDIMPTSFGTSKKRGKGKRKGKGRGGASQGQSQKPNNKWADKCMYAELLEMTEDTGMIGFDGADADGIPSDIETGWVAVTPIPVGKRCLAITHAPSGIAGAVPNTTLRSRVLGKSLMSPFPSSLPPHTILDCILDENWRHTGILHVLDVIKWKGQDIADCETPFRFWWRDTRLSELPMFPPPNALSQQTSDPVTHTYQFQYPSTLVCVPYHLDLSISSLASQLIPLSRSVRQVSITIPTQYSARSDGIETDASGAVKLLAETVNVQSDGMLLYVAQATYEPGTSPLSLWVPVKTYTERTAESDVTRSTSLSETEKNGPMDVFERLIARRLAVHPPVSVTHMIH